MASVSVRDHDPAWLVELAREQEPSIADALAKCRTVLRETHAYIYFVPDEDANRPGAEWQFGRCVQLEHASEGLLVVDVLKDGRIGGVEFVDRI
jgi:hypothetical protein